LQSDGLIEYKHGKMRIVNAEGLKRVACECRAAVAQVLETFKKSLPHVQ
jgi:hypothetical protein